MVLRDSQGVPPRDVVELAGVTKVHPGGVRALDGVSVGFGRGSFTAVMGPSGSGKSTLLHCAAGLDRPTSGRVVLAGKDIASLREPRLTAVRRAHVGFVFQSFNLVDSLSVWDNVLLPQQLAGVWPDRAWARELLARVGLAGREKARPGQLSGGQQQRVAWSEGFSYEFDECGPMWTLSASLSRGGGTQENFRLPLRSHPGSARHCELWVGRAGGA